MSGEKIAAAAQHSDFGALDVDLDVVDRTFERLIVQPSDGNGNALDAGAIRVAEGALPKAGFAARARD